MAITVQNKAEENINAPCSVYERLGYLADSTVSGHSPRCKRKGFGSNAIHKDSPFPDRRLDDNKNTNSVLSKCDQNGNGIGIKTVTTNGISVQKSEKGRLKKSESVIEKDINNNESSAIDKDDTHEATVHKSGRRRRKFEPLLYELEEEIENGEVRTRRDTMYTEDESPIALLIRSELDSYTRYRCLTLVQQVPSHRLYSKYYSSRPYLLAYTKWLANAGVYHSTGIRTSNRKSSLFPGNSSPRRGSLMPPGSRRGSMVPNINLSRRGSMQPEANKNAVLNHEAAIEAIRLRESKKAEKSQRKFGLLVSLFSCVSRPKPPVIDESEQPT